MNNPRVHRLISQLIFRQTHCQVIKSPIKGPRLKTFMQAQSVRTISGSCVTPAFDSQKSLSSLSLQSTSSSYLKRQEKRRTSEDPFIQQLSEVKTLASVIELFEHTSDNITINGAVNSLDVVFEFLRVEKSPEAKKEALYSVGMQKFLKTVRRHSRHMDAGDLISVVKLLMMFGASGSDSTLQIALKLLTKHANGLDLQQIFYLQFLLGRMTDESKSALSGALEYALPVVFESQLSTQMETDNIRSLCDYLHYASKYDLSQNAVQKLVNAILRISDRISPRNAMSILWSFCDIKKDAEYQEPLINICFKHVTNSMDEFKVDELNTIIVKAAKKYMKKVQYFYNEDFVQEYCNKLMSRYVDPNQTLYSFRSVSALRHVHVEYMDRVGDLIAANPSEVLNSDVLFLQLVRSFSGCNYRPDKWSKFEALFLDHPALTKDLGFKDISLALDFLALDAYPEQMIHKIYSPEELPRLDCYLQRNTYVAASNLVLLYNAVKILHPEYSGPLPPISMIEKWKEITKYNNSKRGYILKNALRAGFGGENYVMNGVYHDGLHIDHAIVMRKGGFPIAVNPKTTVEQNGLSDIQKPAESVIVLVKVFYKEAYSNNTNRLRGILALEQKIIERIGHPLLTLDAERWSELLDHEKIPFIMHRIREKIEKFQWNQSSSDVIPH